VAGVSFGGHTAFVAAGARPDPDGLSTLCARNPDDGICNKRARTRVPMTDACKKKTLASPEIAAERARAGESHAPPELRVAFAMAPGPIQMLDPASLVAIRTPVSIMLGDDDKDVLPVTNGLIAARRSLGRRSYGCRASVTLIFCLIVPTQVGLHSRSGAPSASRRRTPIVRRSRQRRIFCQDVGESAVAANSS
jgi:hypothetical protein